MPKLYPSQEKYLAENPAITCRVKKEEKEKIDRIVELTGKSISQLFRETLFYAEKEYSEVYDKGYSEGYDHGYNNGNKQGKIDWQIMIPCNCCDGDLFLKPNSAEHKFIKDYLKKCNWGHQECYEKNFQNTC